MADLTLPDPPLSDGVVTLRGFESGDVAPLVEICQDPEIPRWTLVPDVETLGLERVEIHVDEHNAPSRAVAVRTGFTQVAEPVLQRAETAHFTDDIFLARTRGG